MEFLIFILLWIRNLLVAGLTIAAIMILIWLSENGCKWFAITIVVAGIAAIFAWLELNDDPLGGDF